MIHILAVKRADFGHFRYCCVNVAKTSNGSIGIIASARIRSIYRVDPLFSPFDDPFDDPFLDPVPDSFTDLFADQKYRPRG